MILKHEQPVDESLILDVWTHIDGAHPQRLLEKQLVLSVNGIVFWRTERGVFSNERLSELQTLTHLYIAHHPFITEATSIY